GLFDATLMTPLELTELLPAAGQGALALQCRKKDTRVIELLRALNDASATTCVNLERHVVQRLKGDCTSPIAAYCIQDQGKIALSIAIGKKNGDPPVLQSKAEALVSDAQLVLDQCLKELSDLGVESHLHG